MGNLFAARGFLEATHHLDDGIGFTDMAEKLVPETLPGAGTSNQACDVDDLQRGGNQFLRLDVVTEDGKSGIGNRHDTNIGFDGGKGVIGRVSPGGGQRIEEGRLAHIGQTNYSSFHRCNSSILDPVC